MVEALLLSAKKEMLVDHLSKKHMKPLQVRKEWEDYISEVTVSPCLISPYMHHTKYSLFPPEQYFKPPAPVSSHLSPSPQKIPKNFFFLLLCIGHDIKSWFGQKVVIDEYIMKETNSVFLVFSKNTLCFRTAPKGTAYNGNVLS